MNANASLVAQANTQNTEDASYELPCAAMPAGYGTRSKQLGGAKQVLLVQYYLTLRSVMEIWTMHTMCKEQLMNREARGNGQQ